MFPRLRLSNTKMLYRAKVEDTDFKLWEKNRAIDLERVDEIIKTFRSDNYQFVPGYITVFQKDNEYYIIDGQHRYAAAKEFSETDFKNISMDVCVIESVEPDIILQEFQTVNKSVPPPEYLLNAEVNKDKRELCENIVEWLANDYKEFSMKSKKPKKPNFRKDDLNNTLYETLPNNVTYELVKQKLLELNEYVKQNIDKYETRPAKKCEKYGFYLLYNHNWGSDLKERLSI